jgi:hypothetical protein
VAFLGCPVLPERYIEPPSPGPDWVCRGCDGIELIMVCLKAGFNGWLELTSGYAD